MSTPLATRQASGAADWLEIARPFSWTASVVPVLVGTGVAVFVGQAAVGRFLLALVGSVLLQAGTNIVNEVFDVRRGVDTLATPRASRVLVEGRLDAAAAYRGGLLCFLGAVAIGAIFSWGLGLGAVPFGLGLLGALAGYFYTAPPVEYKYRALGTPLVFFLMGPLMVLGAQFVQSGAFTAPALWASLPVGFLVSAILHANELRDVDDDQAAGVLTLPRLLGPGGSVRLYDGLLLGSYLAVAAAIMLGALPVWTAAVAITLPLANGCVRRSRGRDLAFIDRETAKLHLSFGLVLTVALLWSGVLGV